MVTMVNVMYAKHQHVSIVIVSMLCQYGGDGSSSTAVSKCQRATVSVDW